MMSNHESKHTSETRETPEVVKVRIRDEFVVDLSLFQATIRQLEAELDSLENSFKHFTTKNSRAKFYGR